VLAHDLVCEVHGLDRAAIEIVASNVTVDLGGHALFGYPVGELGIRAEGVDGVTVKNGTIDGFRIGLTFAEGSDATAEELTIRNLEIEDPDVWVIGVWLNDCQDVVVRNATFEFLHSYHKSGVEAWGSDFTVDTVASNGGALGVEINFGSTGEVVNSRFLGANIAGVLIEGSDGARIAHNDFVRNEVGIGATSYESEPITGLTIEANSIKDGFVGIRFQGISESTVQDNVVRGHSRGISLEPYLNCQDPPGPECYYSTGNVITGNEVLDSFVDLYHHENCVPNTWEWNICRTKEGAEIPQCWGNWRRPGRRLKPVSP
jgi:nitrous oxidase accessory protein NosD